MDPTNAPVLRQKLSALTGDELAEVLGRRAADLGIDAKKQAAAEAVQEYIRKGNSIADYGEGHPMNAAALEMHRQATEQEEDQE